MGYIYTYTYIGDIVFIMLYTWMFPYDFATFFPYQLLMVIGLQCIHSYIPEILMHGALYLGIEYVFLSTRIKGDVFSTKIYIPRLWERYFSAAGKDNFLSTNHDILFTPYFLKSMAVKDN